MTFMHLLAVSQQNVSLSEPIRTALRFINEEEFMEAQITDSIPPAPANNGLMKSGTNSLGKLEVFLGMK